MQEAFTFVRCRCGLVYKSRDQTSAAEQPDVLWNEHYTKRRRHRVAKSRRQILDLLNHVEPGPLLDVGCSLGHTLQAATELGLDCRGLDINPKVLEICREQGFDVRLGDIDGPYPFDTGTFRMVVLKHVLEHTPEPRSGLREVRRVLAPGGAVFIAVPNLDFYLARLSPTTHPFYTRGGAQHFVYYAARHLADLAEQEGFRVARIHPHLWQQRASAGQRALQLLTLPPRAMTASLRTHLGLRREFWLIAVREPDSAPR